MNQAKAVLFATCFTWIAASVGFQVYLSVAGEGNLVFGALGGWLLLGEVMSGRMLLGAMLMLAGILVSLRGTQTSRQTRARRPRAGAAGTRAT